MKILLFVPEKLEIVANRGVGVSGVEDNSSNVQISVATSAGMNGSYVGEGGEGNGAHAFFAGRGDRYDPEL